MNSEGDKLRRRDLFRMAFFGGGTFVIILLMIFGIANESDVFHNKVYDDEKMNNLTILKNKIFWKAIKASNPIYRFTFMNIYLYFAVGCAI